MKKYFLTFILFITLLLPIWSQGFYFDIGGGIGFLSADLDLEVPVGSHIGLKIGGGPFENIPLFIVGDVALIAPVYQFLGIGVNYYPWQKIQLGASLGPSIYWFALEGDTNTGFGWHLSAGFHFGKRGRGLLGIEYHGAVYPDFPKKESEFSNLYSEPKWIIAPTQISNFGIFIKYSFRGDIPKKSDEQRVEQEKIETETQIKTTTEDIGDGITIIRENDEITRLQVTSIIFRADHADFEGLSPAVLRNNENALRRIAEILNMYKDYKVTIEGHANATTRPGTSERAREESALRLLSEQRALKIAGELLLRGVSLNRINPVGAGISNMLFPYDDRENNWKNRRVEFILER